eukprot:4680281-Prymnesium_polylepis.1
MCQDRSLCGEPGWCWFALRCAKSIGRLHGLWLRRSPRRVEGGGAGRPARWLHATRLRLHSPS